MSAVALISENFKYVAGKNPDLVADFYALLFERYPEARPLFAKSDMDFQKTALTNSLAAVVEHVEDPAWLTATLTTVGRKHVAYGVEDHMYDWVRDCLIDTFKAISADRWSAELHDAWFSVLGAVNDLALKGAAQARSES